MSRVADNRTKRVMGGEILRFARFIRELTRRKIYLLLLLMFVGSLTEGLSLFLLLPLLTLIDPAAAGGVQIPVIGDWLVGSGLTLGPLLVAFVVSIACLALVNRAKSIAMAHTVHQAMDRLRLSLFRHVGAARWEKAGRLNPADINHLMTGEIDRVQLTMIGLLALIQTAAMLIIYTVLAALVSWQVALLATVVGLALFALLYPIRRRASRFGHELSQLQRDKSATMLSFLTGIRIAKSFVVEDEYNARLNAHLRAVRDKTIGFVRLSSVSSLTFQIVSAAIAAGFVWVSVVWFDLALPEIALLLLIFIRLAPRFQVLQEAVQHLLTNLPAYTNLDRQIEAYAFEAEMMPAANVSVPRLRRHVRFEGVSLQFEGSDAMAVRGVDMTIEHGKTTAIIGPSGSGKSTIADLLLGLLRPTHGRIVVDDVALDDANRRLWRASVAFVPQEPFLLNDTIATNLRIASAAATPEAMRAALDLANAKFVHDLPDGLETIVGERGTRFSGGERQRIALARALLRKPNLLILDEATSALDWENQEAIAAAIESLRHDLTIVTIAHRPSMIDFADNIIAMEAGHVVEEGDYQDLAVSEGSRLHKLLRNENVAHRR